MLRYRRSNRFVIVFGLAAALLAACGSVATEPVVQEELPPPDAVVEEAKELSKALPDHMSASELKQRLDSDNPPMLIDVRGLAERNEVRIEATDMHIPMDIFAQSLEAIPKDGNVVLYCHLGIRSNAARAWVESQGIPISHLSGGIEAWLFDQGF